MGLWDRLLGRDNPSSYEPAQIVQPDPYEPFVSTGGIPVADPGAPVEWYILDKDRRAVEKFWREQPNLRKVVDYIARSIASTPLHLFDRAGDTDRVRVRDGALAGLLRTPAPRQGSYRFWHAVMSDSLLYDRWAVYVDRLFDGSVQLVHVPSWRLSLTTDPLRRVTGARYWVGDSLGRDQQWVDVPLDSLVFDYGYAPRGAGLSPVETLRDVLDENVEAVKYRRDVWRNGVRTPAQVTRPVDAPEWDPTKRDRFVAALRATYGRDGAQAGGMPLMEDGMKVEPLDVFKPSDVHDIEGRRLSAVEVSAAYHIAPELVGAQQGTFSNIDAFRQMLYGPSLGPYILAWEDALNAQLVPMLAPGTTQYVEANVESKLRGSFLEQAQILQSATGAPWMLRNEARAKLNLPALPDGDELVVPLNVLVGGQASPNDAGAQNLNASEPLVAKGAEVLRAFYKRQGSVVTSAMGAKSAEWWDGARWDREMAADVKGFAVMVAHEAAALELDLKGFGSEQVDEALMSPVLSDAVASFAASANEAVRARIAGRKLSPSDAFRDLEASAEAVAADLVEVAALAGLAEARRQFGIASGA